MVAPKTTSSAIPLTISLIDIFSSIKTVARGLEVPRDTGPAYIVYQYVGTPVEVNVCR